MYKKRMWEKNKRDWARKFRVQFQCSDPSLWCFLMWRDFNQNQIFPDNFPYGFNLCFHLTDPLQPWLIELNFEAGSYNPDGIWFSSHSSAFLSAVLSGAFLQTDHLNITMELCSNAKRRKSGNSIKWLIWFLQYSLHIYRDSSLVLMFCEGNIYTV